MTSDDQFNREIINYGAYPILDKERRRDIVISAREQLAKECCVCLPGFVTKDAAAKMAAEASAGLGKAYRRDKSYSAYKTIPSDIDLPQSHPRRQEFWNNQYVVPTDILPADGLIRSLYSWDGLTHFVAELLSEPELYCLADPFMSCVSTIMEKGDQHGWHFDLNDFVVSLMLQPARMGGNFEFAPYIRTQDDENYPGVAEVLSGKTDKIIHHVVEAGTLMIFCGKQSIHRVSPVQGGDKRVIALFSYDRTPNTIYNAEVWRRAVGRETYYSS